MGYYTDYSLSMVGSQHGDAQKIYDFSQEKDMGIIYGFTVWGDYLETSDSMKWYKHEDEMRIISKEFPHILFELHGNGEDTEDIWDEYYRDGKMQRCKAEIVIPPFDESKMT